LFEENEVSENAGEKVTLVGWFENIRKVSKNLGFVILRDFYGTTQIVVETEDLMEQFSAINTESTIEVTGTVRERSSKNPKLATGDIEVVPETVKVLGKCQFFFRSGTALDCRFAEGTPGAGIELTLSFESKLCFRAECFFCPFLQLGHGDSPSGHIFPARLED